MKKYKNLSLLVGASLSILTLAACSNNEDTEKKDSEKKVENKNPKDPNTQKVEEKEIKEIKKEVLHNKGIVWFSNVDELKASLTNNKINFNKELITFDLVDETGKKTEENNVIEAKTKYLGHDTTMTYYFGNKLNYHEPVDVKDVEKGFKLSELNTEELVLKQIVYNIPSVSFKEFKDTYIKEHGEPLLNDETVLLYADYNTTINIVEFDGNISITIAPTEELIRSISDTYQIFEIETTKDGEPIVEGEVIKDDESQEKDVENKK